MISRFKALWSKFVIDINDIFSGVYPGSSKKGK